MSAATRVVDLHDGDETSQSPGNVRGRRPGVAKRCHICAKTFSKHEHLRRHIRSHNKERPFVCQACGRSFSRSDTLQRHERSNCPGVTSGVAGPQDGASHDHISNETSVNETANDPVLPLVNLPAEPLQHDQHGNHGAQTDAVGNDDLLSTVTQVYNPVDALYSAPLVPDFDLSTWESPQTADSAPWLISNDFDILALDEALTSTVSDWLQIPNHVFDPAAYSSDLAAGLDAPNPFSESRNAVDTLPDSSMPLNKDTALEGVGRQWFTRLETDENERVPSRAGSETQAGQLSVDERYRDRVSRKLRPRTHDGPLPSVSSLNLFLRLYGTRFHPIFPVIHMQSFRPTSQNAFLLLSMCSIGSLFVGSALARSRGRDIFLRLNKVILAGWDSLLSRGKVDALAMLQTALLGQTFAILSGHTNDLILADMFHGTMLSWARKLGMFTRPRFELPEGHLDEHRANKLWHEWIYIESCCRFALALGVHDSELASLFHHHPLLRQDLSVLSVNDALFNAPSAGSWMRAFRDFQHRQSFPTISYHAWLQSNLNDKNSVSQAINDSTFMAYSLLQSINASIVENRHCGSLSPDRVNYFRDGLILWRQVCREKQILDRPINFDAQILWHAVFIFLYVDVDKLEVAVGRDGAKTMHDAGTAVQDWRSTQDATRCLIHALLLQEQVEATRVGSELAVHVPRALYVAGLVWLLASRPNLVPLGPLIDMSAFELPEFQALDTTSAARFLDSMMLSAELIPRSVALCYTLVDLLQRLGRWGIAANLAKALSAALDV